MLFAMVLVDLTTEKLPEALRPGKAFGMMIDAFTEQLDHDYSNSYSMPEYDFRAACDPTDREVGEIALNFRDAIPEAPEALAYHTVTDGVPDIEIGCNLFETLLKGQDSISCGVSHEILEMLGDSGANAWCDRQDQTFKMDARELCDFVQNTSYETSHGVTVSNFVLESFFIPGSSGPWDFLNVMQHRHDVSHGYGIQAPSPGATTQIGGMHLRHMVGAVKDNLLARKRHAYSRTYRRGVRV